MTRTEQLNKILSDLQSNAADIQACAVVSEDGLIIASSLPQGTEEGRVAAMSAALLSMGSRTSAELARGDLEQIFVRGALGYIIISNAGPHAALLALARSEAKLGLLFYELARAGEATKGILT